MFLLLLKEYGAGERCTCQRRGAKPTEGWQQAYRFAWYSVAAMCCDGIRAAMSKVAIIASEATADSTMVLLILFTCISSDFSALVPLWSYAAPSGVDSAPVGWA
ncbi:hypothetical protein D9M68_868120 [compost metagenome]